MPFHEILGQLPRKALKLWEKIVYQVASRRRSDVQWIIKPGNCVQICRLNVSWCLQVYRVKLDLKNQCLHPFWLKQIVQSSVCECNSQLVTVTSCEAFDIQSKTTLTAGAKSLVPAVIERLSLTRHLSLNFLPQLRPMAMESTLQKMPLIP